MLADRRSWPYGRALLAGAILVAEVLLLRERYTTDTLQGVPGAWASLVRFTRFNTPWGLAAAAGVLLVGWARLRSELVLRRDALTRSPAPWKALLAHTAAFATFYGATALLLETPPRGALAWLLLGVWTAIALLSLLSLVALVFPLRPLAEVARSARWVLLGGLLTGTAAFGFGLFALAGRLWVPLAHGTVWLSHFLVDLMFADSVYDQHTLVLGTDRFLVQISKYCSGYEGISLVLVFFGVFLSLSRERLRFPQVLVVLPVGALAIWLVNSLRVALLVAVGTMGSTELAIGGFHSYAGWILFSAIALGGVALTTRMRVFAADPSRPRLSETVNPTAVYLVPFLAVLGTSMLLGALAPEPRALYPVKILAALPFLWIYRREYGALRPGWSWTALGLGALTAGLWILLLPAASDDPIAWQRAAPVGWVLFWWVMRVIGSIAIVPLAEELAFRGYLLRRLVSADFEHVPPQRAGWVAVLVSSTVFGLLHGAWLAGIVAGVLFALAYRRRGRLFDAVLAHAWANGLLAAAAAATGRWSIWL
jgi:exosortase E/protease (VPEID-CTERM system)